MNFLSASSLFKTIKFKKKKAMSHVWRQYFLFGEISGDNLQYSSTNPGEGINNVKEMTFQVVYFTFSIYSVKTWQ